MMHSKEAHSIHLKDKANIDPELVHIRNHKI